MVAAGEVIGYVKQPFTGDIVHEFRAVRGGVMVHAGASWPIVPEDAVLAILGDPAESVTDGPGFGWPVRFLDGPAERR